MTSKKRKKERLAKDAHICIVGSGLAGLGAAISLQQAGFTRVTILERDSANSTRKGYGMTLSYNANGPLAQMGVLEDVALKDCPSRSHYVFHSDGSILGYYGNAFVSNRGQGQRGNLRVPRNVLLDLLRNRLEVPTCIQYNKRLCSFSYYKSMESEQPKMALHFQDESTIDNVDLLVAADGIRSSVVDSLLTTEQSRTAAELQYLGIFLILGISDFLHPLTDERGFYTLDGTHRLFTMPYEGDRLDEDHDRRIMWQLSFRLENHGKAKRLAAAGPEALREEVTKRCANWHKPAMDMIHATPVHTIWGTALMDRDPEVLSQQVDSDLSRRVVILGDAAHPMSCFKGQGANQALMDGPLLASWLEKASLDSAIKGYMREMTKRTSPKVLASRKAAQTLHSHSAIRNVYDFAGVCPERIPELLEALRKGGISAYKAHRLDSCVWTVIRDLGINVDETAPNISDEIHRQAIEHATSGDTRSLRNLSLTYPSAVISARDGRGMSCLHVAVSGGHYETCRWLLTEVFSTAAELVDATGQTPLDIAVRSGHTRIVTLLS
jgi:2-polyprenyl-6-methoxyphenol hydroxylase-like FAD-dependent oxidoreductase